MIRFCSRLDTVSQGGSPKCTLPAAGELRRESSKAGPGMGDSKFPEQRPCLAVSMVLSERFRSPWDSKCDPQTSSTRGSPRSVLKMQGRPHPALLSQNLHLNQTPSDLLA